MCEKTRKVTFSLGRYEFDPDTTPLEISEMEEMTKERQGYFHCWTNEVDTSKDIPFVKAMALVEDLADGKVYMVDYNLITFMDHVK